jgi:hypothetical protein
MPATPTRASRPATRRRDAPLLGLVVALGLTPNIGAAMEQPRPEAAEKTAAASTPSVELPDGSGDYRETLALADQYRQGALPFDALVARLTARHLKRHALGCDYLMNPVPMPPPGVRFEPRLMPADWEGTWGEVAMAYWLGVLTREEYDRLHAIAHPQCATQHGVTRERAAELAREAVARLGGNHDMVLLEEEIQEREFGWVFRFAPKKYIETHDPRHMVPGLGPVAVERAGGATTFLATSVHPDAAIAEFERRWRAGRAVH